MVTDLNQELVSELVGMGAGTGSYSEAPVQRMVVMMILPKCADIVKYVIFDEGGIASSMKKGKHHNRPQLGNTC